MKKLCFLFLTLLILLTLSCAQAEDTPRTYTSGSWRYILLEDGTAEISSYTGQDSHVDIPANINGYTVTSIGTAAFRFNYDVQTVTIPDSITNIGMMAFHVCPQLSSLTLPDSIVSIGEYAFASTGITSLTIPESVEYIGDYVFFDCQKLASLTLPNSPCTYASAALATCDSAIIHIPDDHPVFTMIDGVLFNTLTQTLVSYPRVSNSPAYDVPQGIVEIGSHAFYYSQINSITLPDSVVNIADAAFQGCFDLVEITIPDSVTNIGSLAFNGCMKLTHIELPNTISAINESAFFYCTSLQEIIIPDSITSIDAYAFAYCSSLNSLVLPASIESIGRNILQNTSDQLVVTVPSGSYAQEWCESNGVSYIFAK